MGKINYENLTYRQLKEMVPATPRGKMPKPTQIKGRVLFRSEKHGAKIVVFKNGYLTYTKNDGFGDPCTTVYSVHKCSQMVYQGGCSKSEFDDECGRYGDYNKLIYCIINGQYVRFSIISDEVYLDEPWWMPIVLVCDDRLTRNADARENKDKVSLEQIIDILSDEDVDVNFADDIVIDISDEDDENFIGDVEDSETWLEPDIRNEEQAKDHKRLSGSLAKLKVQHANQHKVIKLRFRRNGMSEREIAKHLNIKHQSVHDIIRAGIKNLLNNFFE